MRRKQAYSWDSMTSMAIERRQFLVLGAAALAGLPTPIVAASEERNALYASSIKQADGRYAVVVLTELGEILQTIPLAGRGHDICISPDRTLAIVFARRPGTFAVAFDPQGKAASQLLQSRPDRHFYGHGVFSQDGRLLYATENDFDNARGVLGVYDVAAGFRRIGEFESHGIGPHDLLLLEDGRTLCVANGGIETHPAAGRTKLNLQSMSPSIVFIDRETGDLLSRHETSKAIHRLSLRHLSSDHLGNVWFGGQWEGDLGDSPILIGHVSREKPIAFCSAPETLGSDLKGYIGSITASRDGSVIAASAPRAGRTILIDVDRNSLSGEIGIVDGCGIAPARERDFLITSGEGEIRRLIVGRPGLHSKRLEGIAFDNHAALIGTN